MGNAAPYLEIPVPRPFDTGAFTRGGDEIPDHFQPIRTVRLRRLPDGNFLYPWTPLVLDRLFVMAEPERVATMIWDEHERYRIYHETGKWPS